MTKNDIGDAEKRVPGDPDYALDKELDKENEGILEQGRGYRRDGSVRDPRIPTEEAQRGGDARRAEPQVDANPIKGERAASEKHSASGRPRKGE